jgi:hypothetical protein
LYLWDTPTEPRTSYRWRSKEYHLPAPVNLGAFILHARDHGYNGGTPSPTPPPQTITLRVWAQDTAGDMVLLFDQLVTPYKQTRMPSEMASDVWQFELEGDMDVLSLQVAETGTELRGA